jgi:hypothetical protein
MKNGNSENGNSENGFDSIAEHLRRQDVALELLVHHVAYVEAILAALVFETLPEKSRRRFNKLRVKILSHINDDMIAELEHKLENL